MIERLFLLSDYLNSSNILNSLRRLFNLLFCFSISAFIYKIIFGQYNWYNFNEYILILDFFVNGDFFVPFSIFVLVFSLTEIPAYILLNPNLKITKTGIHSKAEEYGKTQQFLYDLFEISKEKDPTPMSFEERIKLFVYNGRKSLSRLFTFMLRLFLAIIVYYINSANFKILWLIFILLIIFIAFYTIYFILYKLLLMTPDILTKAQELMKKNEVMKND